MRKNSKSTLWNMRATKADKENFAELSRRLGVNSDAEAIRRAVALALETTTRPRRDLRLSPRKTARPSAAMNVQAN